MELGNGKINKFFTLPEESLNRYYIDDFDVDANKYNNNVYLLAECIPEEAVVLDIGCGSGKFGKRLKNKECIVYGVEIDVEAVKYAVATGCYEKIFVFDITDETNSEYMNFRDTIGQVDIIIISDVLEHLANPTQLLISCYQYLKDDGTILVSVPNINHIDITMNLLNGKFNYTDMGILDNTHLKFFTRSSFIEWINQINNQVKDVKYDVEYIGGILYNNKLVEKIKNNHLELTKILECVKDYNALELLFKIKKLKQNQVAVNIDNSLNQVEIDVVKLLGDCLEKDYQKKEIKTSLIISERMLYEDKINELKNSLKWHIEKIQEVNEALEGYQKYVKELEENKQKKNKYIEELENSLKWHIEKIQEVNEALEGYQKYVKELEESKQTTSKYIEELEKSINWHIEKIQEVNEALKWYKDSFEEINNKAIQYKESIKELINLKKENLEFKKKIFEMETSFSWKITKFLRKK